MKIRWTRKTAKFETGWLGRVNKWKLFSIYWNGISATTGRKWIMTCYLPGINKRFYGESEQKLKERADKILIRWLKGLVYNK